MHAPAWDNIVVVFLCARTFQIPMMMAELRRRSGELLSMGQLSGRLRCPASVWHKAVGNIAQPLAPLLLSLVGVVIGAEVAVLVHALVVFNFYHCCCCGSCCCGQLSFYHCCCGSSCCSLLSFYHHCCRSSSQFLPPQLLQQQSLVR